MTKLTQEQLDRLLEQPIYSLDVTRLLGNVVDFFEFSEGHLEWRRRAELRKAEQEGDAVQFDPPDEHLRDSYREHLIENAQYRFDAGLSQSIRHSGLLSFIATLDFCARLFSKRCTWDIPPKPRGASESVHIFRYLKEKSASGLDAQLKDLQNLIFVRNCITHAAGLAENYAYGNEVRAAATELMGIAVWHDPVLGDRINVSEGAIEYYARSALAWVPALDEECTTKGILR